MTAAAASLRWQFHHLVVAGHADDPRLRERWRATFASRPVPTGAVPADLRLTLALGAAVPAPPPRAPDFRHGELLAYYVDGEAVIAHFPRYGQLQLDLAGGVTTGLLLPAALETYGVLEDLLAIALSPHLRRRGLFLIHAFAAARAGRAALIVGAIGAGKTTTGLALLNAGWRLLANDSPILRAPAAEVLSYPGLLAAYPDTFARFPATQPLATAAPAGQGRAKITAAAEAVWPEVWLDQATCAAIVFPAIEPRAAHAVERLTPPEALRRLLPHAVEQWDKAMLPAHLALLGELARSTPAYHLRLGPDVDALPALFETLIAAR